MAPRNWWVWEELNFRPHPYQGCALTNCATDPRPVPLRTKTICVSAHAPYRLLYSRKDVIQPQVPLRLPCYDFTPVIDHTVVGAPLAVRLPASGAISSHGVTGGVYKTRERNHRSNAELRLLAIPTARRRVADSDPDYDKFSGIGSVSRLGFPLYLPL